MSPASAPPGRVGLVAGFVLLVATGFVDAYTFLRHGHVFGEAMTGNFVLIGIGAFVPTIVAFWRPLASVSAFLLGALVLGQASRSVTVHRAAPQFVTILIDVVVLGVVGFLPGSFPQVVVTSAIAFAAGMQSAAFRRVGDAESSTVVMTTNSTRLITTLLEAFESGDEGARQRAGSLLVTLTGFLGGVFLGAGLSTHLHNRAAWVDAGIFLVAGLLYLIHDHRGRTALIA